MKDNDILVKINELELQKGALKNNFSEHNSHLYVESLIEYEKLILEYTKLRCK